MINKIILASNNANKLREFRQILEPLGIEVISQREAGADIEADECGDTFEENAVIKAQAVYDIVDSPVIADDSGICVDAMGGKPGVHSARCYPKGEECDRLIDDMKNVPDENRGAHFACVIALICNEGIFTVTGRCDGTIGYEKRGTNGFGYDPIFMQGNRSFAEMSPEEKNKISHRAKALEELYKLLEERFCD